MSIVKPAIQFPVLIAYLEGANNYTWLHFRDGVKTLLSKSLSYLEKQPELSDFIRIHKTILVNPACIEQLLEPPRAKMAGSAQLEGGLLLPVSRRRWRVVAAQLPTKRVAVLSPPLPVNQAPGQLSALGPALTRPIIAVTDNPRSALLIKEIADQYWSPCPVLILTEGVSLPTLLGQLPPTELPIFILLDARTARQERLNTLQQLKKEDRLGWIPVVLLVTATDAAIRDGYHRQANSVVAISQEHTPFIQTIRRIGQFWLETATLPSLAGGNRAGGVTPIRSRPGSGAQVAG